MKVIRWVLGRLVLLANIITLPGKGRREAGYQAEVDAITRHYALYQFNACPFCVKVRRAIRRLGLSIELRNAKVEGPYRTELLQHGGKIKVPCLRIDHPNGETQWMYESDDIIRFLSDTFPLEKSG